MSYEGDVPGWTETLERIKELVKDYHDTTDLDGGYKPVLETVNSALVVLYQGYDSRPEMIAYDWPKLVYNYLSLIMLGYEDSFWDILESCEVEPITEYTIASHQTGDSNGKPTH